MLGRIQQFSEKADKFEIGGLLFQHITICERRCWLIMNRLSFTHLSEHIRLGTIRHENSHERDISTSGLMGISPDRIIWEESLVVEQKSSTSYLDATIHQAFFYALILSNSTKRIWGVRVNINPSKRNTDIVLNEEKLTKMENLLEKIVHLKQEVKVPNAIRIPACSGCSESEFCWGGRK